MKNNEQSVISRVDELLVKAADPAVGLSDEDIEELTAIADQEIRVVRYVNDDRPLWK